MELGSESMPPLQSGLSPVRETGRVSAEAGPTFALNSDPYPLRGSPGNISAMTGNPDPAKTVAPAASAPNNAAKGSFWKRHPRVTVAAKWVLTSVVLGTGLVLFQEYLKSRLFGAPPIA